MYIKANDYDQYLKSLFSPRQETIKSIVAIIKEELPQADMVMDKGIPVFRLNGEDVLALAAQKYYYTLYFWNMDWTKSNRKHIKKLNLGKGCARFKKLSDFPEPVLREAVRMAGTKT